MSAITANQIIERAMVKARIIYPGESIPASKANQVLGELNDLLDSWSLEGLMILYDSVENFPLVDAQYVYTYGSDGNFNSARPIQLTDGCYIVSGGSTTVLSLVSVDTLIRHVSRGSIEHIVAYSPEYPLGKVMIWPIPSSGTIFLYSRKKLESFPLLSTSIDLPPGYSRAIITNLALEISPNFGKKATNELVSIAIQSKQVVKNANKRRPSLSTPSDLTSLMTGKRGYNIQTGE